MRIFIIFIALTAQLAAQDFPVLGQGVMCGRVTETSVILQSRLTQGMELVNFDSPGAEGVARFEYADNAEFSSSQCTPWMKAEAGGDYIVKAYVDELTPGADYFYRLHYGPDTIDTRRSETASFTTHSGSESSSAVKIAVVTGMNADHFYRRPGRAYRGTDRVFGYPALEAMNLMRIDYFIGTGDNVYYDKPINPFGNSTDIPSMRRRWHEQFTTERFRQLFRNAGTYWMIDDHDYRFNDCDNTGDRLPLPETGLAVFTEQVPFTPPGRDAKPYYTLRVNRDLQLWILEGRLYRSPNDMEDGPEKTIWGSEQREWLEQTLLESDAAYKVLVSATPMVGPDDSYKKDNHTNPGGFQWERDRFFEFITANGLHEQGFAIVCGDRHWQYHSIDTTGIMEFSCGALVDANSRVGRLPGDDASTDPDGLIEQPYCMTDPSGGFLVIEMPEADSGTPPLLFNFYDELGGLFYSYEMQQ